MKILLLDIETAPHKAYVWGLWDQNVALNQVESTGYVLSWAAAWHDKGKIMYADVQGGKIEMLTRIRTLLDEADVVVHYNGTKFDIPTLYKEFVEFDLPPPSPFKQIDLMQVVKREFRFASNKLDHVCEKLGLGQKIRHEGFELWVQCMNGEPTAWAKMEEYNKHDVLLTARLYQRMLPWIKSHPNHSAYNDMLCCPKCGSTDYMEDGLAIASVLKYIRYACQSCGGWFRGNKSVSPRKADRMMNVVS